MGTNHQRLTSLSSSEMHERRERIEQQMQEIARGQKTLGMILTWSVRGVVIERPALETLLANYDLDGDVTLPPIRAARAVKLALRDMAEDKMVREVPTDNPNRTVYALIAEHADRVNEELDYSTALKVSLWHDVPKGTDPLTFSNSAAEAKIRPLVDLYSRCYVARDLTRVCFREPVIGHQGISMRPEGGMYFLPTAEGQIAFKLQAFAAELQQMLPSATVRFSILPILDRPEARESMGWHAYEAILAEVGMLATDLKDMHRATRQGKVKSATVAGYLKRADELAQKATYYRDLLNITAGDFERGINEKLDSLRVGFEMLRTGQSEQQTRASLGMPSLSEQQKQQPAQDEPPF